MTRRLDAIVKGERFFNVEKYPTITFKSNEREVRRAIASSARTAS